MSAAGPPTDPEAAAALAAMIRDVADTIAVRFVHSTMKLVSSPSQSSRIYATAAYAIRAPYHCLDGSAHAPQ